MTGELTGTWQLIRLVLRRDRMLLPLWAVLPCLFPAAFVVAFTTGFPTEQALREYAETSVHNTAFIVTYGALDGASLGELVTWRSGFIPVVIGLLCMLTVIRHTRTEEEAGRRELIAATAVGRHAGLAAALVTTCAGALVLGLLCTLVLTGSGLPIGGALAFGIGLAAAAWAFAAVGGIVAQLTTGAGAARSIGIAVLLLAFLIRGVGDISAQSGGGLGWLSGISPLSWLLAFRPFGGERWWLLPVVLVVVAALVAVAVALSARRDVGSGLLPARSGPAVAAPGLRSPLALAWRLHRGSLAAWLAGFAVVGFALGAIAASIAALLTDSTFQGTDVPAMLGGGQRSIVDQYFTAMVTLLGLASAGYAVQAVLALRVEESSGRAEVLLAAPVDRLRWAASHLTFALLGPAVALLLGGAAMGLAHGVNVGDVAGQMPRVLGAVLVQLPAVWVFTGLAIALFGLLPRFTAGTFALLVLSLLVGWAGAELGLGQWVLDLSLYEHLPQLPGGPFALTPLVVMTVIAVVLAGAGLLALRRRDMPVG